MNLPLVVLAVIGLLGMLLSLAVVDARMLPAAGRSRTLPLSLGCALVGMLTWLALSPLVGGRAVGELFLPITLLAGIAAYLPSIAVRATGGGPVASLAFGAIWTALVFVPTATVSFGPLGSSGLFGVDPVDHGGSLVVNVAAGAAALGVLMAARDAPRLRAAMLPRGLATVAVVVLCASWILWLVAAEWAIDEATPSILVNGAVGALGGAVGWLAVQRIQHRSTTLAAVAAGLISGLVSITAGAPLYTPVSAAASGIIAGGLACMVTLSRVYRTRRQQWYLVGSHLTAGAIGVVLLGMTATNRGFLFTGQVGLIGNQLFAVVVVGLYSAVIAGALWALLRRMQLRRARAAALR